MECRSCSAPLADGARYCSACGTDQTDPGSARTTGGSPRDEAALLKDLVTRTLAGRYSVQRLLGAGGMASVFLADDLTLERTVAIKVLPTDMAHDEKVVARFQREAKTAAKLDHPHIIPIYRVESEGILNYFVMKYVEGRSLDRVMGEHGALDLAFAERVLAEAASALGHAHRKGVVHRDVKPANIMLDADDRVILTDFGISKAAEATSQLTQTGTIMGTPSYMAPEQVLGRSVDGRADQYALAVLGYQMVTGRLPFDGETAHAILYQHVHEPPPHASAARPEIPPRIAEAIQRGMSKDPAARFRTTEEFADALRGAPATPRATSAGTGPRSAAISATAVITTNDATRRVNGGVSGDISDATTITASRADALRPGSAADRGRARSPRRAEPPAHRRSVRWIGVATLAVLATAAATWATRQGRGANLPARHSDSASAAVRPAGESSAATNRPTTLRPPDTAGPNASTSAPSESGAGKASTVPAQPSGPSGASSSAAPTGTPSATSESAASLVRTNHPARGSSRLVQHTVVAPPAPIRAPTEETKRMAPLTVASDPYGTLFVDGLEVGVTPQADYLLAVGRTYEIRVERDGYKPKREMIAVSGPNEIRKRYVLEPLSTP